MGLSARKPVLEGLRTTQAQTSLLISAFVIHIFNRDENSQSFSIRKISLLNPEWSQTDF